MDKSKKKTIYLLLTENPDLNSHSNILWDLALNMSFQLLLRLSSSSAPPPFCGLSPTATKCSGFAPFRVFSKIKNWQAFQPFQHSFKSFSEIRTPLQAGRLRDFRCYEKNSPNRFCRQQNKMKLLQMQSESLWIYLSKLPLVDSSVRQPNHSRLKSIP